MSMAIGAVLATPALTVCWDGAGRVLLGDTGEVWLPVGAGTGLDSRVEGIGAGWMTAGGAVSAAGGALATTEGSTGGAFPIGGADLTGAGGALATTDGSTGGAFPVGGADLTGAGGALATGVCCGAEGVSGLGACVSG
jgi:hypothetical protein